MDIYISLQGHCLPLLPTYQVQQLPSWYLAAARLLSCKSSASCRERKKVQCFFLGPGPEQHVLCYFLARASSPPVRPNLGDGNNCSPSNTNVKLFQNANYSKAQFSPERFPKIFLLFHVFSTQFSVNLLYI